MNNEDMGKTKGVENESFKHIPVTFKVVSSFFIKFLFIGENYRL